MPAGLLFVDKPAGFTSHDIVARVRRAARSRRVGHAGTLDPFATGLLVLAVGSATRLLQFVDGEPKVYVADIAFGVETDTDDVTGNKVRVAPSPRAEAVRAAMTSLTGPIKQIPPVFSAKHVSGQRAYELARKGKPVSLDPVDVTVHEWRVLDESANALRVQVTCTGGTYIRALARDLGRAAGSAAHCASLRRISSGPVSVSTAVALSELAPDAIADGMVQLVNPLHALVHMPRLMLDSTQQAALRQGRKVSSSGLEGHHVVFIDGSSNILGIGERVTTDSSETSLWQPRVVLDSTGEAA